MKKQLFYSFLLVYFIFSNNLFPQDVKSLEVSQLFISQKILPVKLSYSNKFIKKNTNDSTYIKTDLSYKENDSWKNIDVEIRVRGGFRRRTCYFTPMKLKIKKVNSKETLFKGNKKLKLVLSCLRLDGANDEVVNEYMAYKLYEVISPYHFKTRLLDVDYMEVKGKKTINHKLKGIFIEDDKKVAKRHNAKRLKNFIHPLGQDAITSVQNAFFQYMIGNTDYSTGKLHNEKLLYLNKKAIPVPYDFDMSGLVDASYAIVSQISKEPLDIKKVTERMYRGFKRDEKIFQQVRKEFLDKKAIIFDIIDSFEPFYDHKSNFTTARMFISDFFEIMSDDAQFRMQIIGQARSR